MFISTWPAPAAPSIWSQAPCQVPATGRVVVRDHRPTARKPAAAPARRRSTPAPVAAAADLFGCALVLNTWMSPTADGPVWAGARMRYAPGSMDRILRRVKAGTDRVRLIVDHDDDGIELATTDDSLRLWVDGRCLMFSVTGRTRRGRLAVEIARPLLRTHRQVSIGAYPTRWLAVEGQRPMVATITEARMFELSLVPEGACRGTFAVIG